MDKLKNEDDGSEDEAEDEIERKLNLNTLSAYIYRYKNIAW